jgi:hypothetical protein
VPNKSLVICVSILRASSSVPKTFPTAIPGKSGSKGSSGSSSSIFFELSVAGCFLRSMDRDRKKGFDDSLLFETDGAIPESRS